MSACSGQRGQGREAQHLRRQSQEHTQEHACHSIRGSHGHPCASEESPAEDEQKLGEDGFHR